MTTVSDILLNLVHDLGQVSIYTATGGSTTTAVNANTGKEDADLSGWIIITETTDGLAPQGEFANLSSFEPSTGTFTFDALTTAVESGDKFAFITNSFPLNTVLHEVNRGLKRLGWLQGVDSTTLDTVTDQTEFSASVAWKHKILGIQVQGNTGDSDNNLWHWWHKWRYVPATSGNAGQIEFTAEPTSSRDIRVWYQYQHETVSTYDDVIDERIDQNLATAASLERVLAWSVSRAQGNNSFELQRWNEAKADLEDMRRMYPIERVKIPGKVLVIG